MKKVLISFGLMLVILFSFSINVNAFTYNIALEPNKTSVKQGEKVEIVINLTELSLASGEAAILGLEGNLDYDTTVFSKAEVTAESNWKGSLDYTAGNKRIVGMVLSASNELKTTGKLAKVTLTVADDSAIGDTTVKFKNIQLSNGATANSTTIPDISKTIKIESKSSIPTTKAKLSKITITKVPTKVSYKEGEKVDLTGFEITATYEDGTREKVTNYEYSPKTELKTSDTKIVISYTENGVTKTIEQPITVTAIKNNDDNKNTVKPENNVIANNTTNNTTRNNTTNNNSTLNNNSTKDNTVSNKVISKAGLETMSTMAVAILLVISVVTYINYKKYKNM